MLFWACNTSSIPRDMNTKGRVHTTDFWNVTPCIFVSLDKPFRRTCYLHFQGVMSGFFETFVRVYHLLRLHIQKATTLLSVVRILDLIRVVAYTHFKIGYFWRFCIGSLCNIQMSLTKKMCYCK